MMDPRIARGVMAVALVGVLLPIAPAAAARNKPPKITKAEMKDVDGDGLADRVVLTYSEKIRHKVDLKKFPFKVQGYRIQRVGAVKGLTKLGIVLKENPDAPLKPASVRYTRTRQQPVLDMKRKQARKQLLTKNILGLVAEPPPVERFTLTTALAGDGTGMVTSSDSRINCGSTCSATYDEGTVVTLSATPDGASGASFAGWTGCSSATDSCTVTMDGDKTVTATFDGAGSYSLTVTKAGTGSGTVTSTSTPTQASQINCGSTCSVSFPEGTLVTLQATPQNGTSSTFAGWSGGGCTGTGTCNVLMDQVRSVTATFNLPTQYTLVVNNSGGTGSGTVSSSDGKINCGSVCTADFPKDSVVTLTATPAPGSLFSGWGGAATCPATSTSCQVPVSADPTTVSTIFSPSSTTMHQLTVTKTGLGAVTSDPSGITCEEAASVCAPATFADGTIVTLTAEPAPGMRVKAWGGDCSGTADTCQLAMTGPKSAAVEFELDLPLPTRSGTQP